MSQAHILETKLETVNSAGRVLRHPATLAFVDGRIEFLKSPFALKDEIKCMKGSKWHGFEPENPRKIWSVKDCARNRFQLAYLQGQDVYEWFDRELRHWDYERPLMEHQKHLADSGLTYHFQIWAAEMGVGKTLAAIEVIEKSMKPHWWWVGPKPTLKGIEREFAKWGLTTGVQLMTYDRMVSLMDTWEGGDVPHGVIFDESSRLKNESSQRTRAGQYLADLIRAAYNYDGYVIEMSGTPSPKTPIDWWSQAEIAWPGFLKEGSPKALEARLAFLQDAQHDAGFFKKRTGWRDDDKKCNKCGLHFEDGAHDRSQQFSLDNMGGQCEYSDDEYHDFEPCENEVAYLYERLKGLVVVKHKKDCLDLPDKRYRKVECKPSSSILRVAKAIANSSANAMIAASLLRELSDGFQYRDVPDGTKPCSHCQQTGKVEEWFDPEDEEQNYTVIEMLSEELQARLEKRTVDCPACGGTGEVAKTKRITREIPCPKEDALVELLEENEEHGRIVVFGGFTGSVDRITRVCLNNGWDVVRVDGRGWSTMTQDASGVITLDVEPLDYWANVDVNRKVAFVSHPESGGMGLTLVEASMEVFWSNSFKPEYRIQAEDRIHRPGMDDNRGATIVDLLHLPSDDRVLEVIRENRKLEKMSMGEFQQSIDWSADESE